MDADISAGDVGSESCGADRCGAIKPIKVEAAWLVARPLLKTLFVFQHCPLSLHMAKALFHRRRAGIDAAVAGDMAAYMVA